MVMSPPCASWIASGFRRQPPAIARTDCRASCAAPRRSGASRRAPPVRDCRGKPSITGRSSTRGTPRDICGSSGWMSDRSSSLDSLRRMATFCCGRLNQDAPSNGCPIHGARPQPPAARRTRRVAPRSRSGRLRDRSAPREERRSAAGSLVAIVAWVRRRVRRPRACRSRAGARADAWDRVRSRGPPGRAAPPPRSPPRRSAGGRAAFASPRATCTADIGRQAIASPWLIGVGCGVVSRLRAWRSERAGSGLPSPIRWRMTPIIGQALAPSEAMSSARSK